MKTHRRTNRSLPKFARIAFLAAASSLLAACAGVQQPAAGPSAVATLEPRSGSSVSGKVTFTGAGQKTHVEAHVSGLTPGAHGFHVHEVGDCSAPDASSAKGHFSPVGRRHGSPGSAEHHAGDMPNLVADASGKATYSADLDMLPPTEGGGGIVKRSVVVHADPDDYVSQPAGNSGKRVACGVIQAVAGGSY